MKDSMVPGDYTAIGTVNIRTQMKTTPQSNLVGGYTNGVPFRVYQVYDEVDGILWGRVSSNTGSGKARYVALRVANNVKAVLEQAFEDELIMSGDKDLKENTKALLNNTEAINLLIEELRDVTKNEKR